MAISILFILKLPLIFAIDIAFEFLTFANLKLQRDFISIYKRV
jgi:hypothetical protein